MHAFHPTNNAVLCLQPTDINRQYLYAALMFVFPMFGAVAYVHSSRLSIIVQIQLRAELTAAVYRKALRLSSRYTCLPLLLSLLLTHFTYLRFVWAACISCKLSEF